MMAALQALRDELAEIEGVASVAIGRERNISPDDYPLIRLEPLRALPGRPYHQRTVECLAYFGAKIADSEGMETVYTALLEMEAAILEVLRANGCRYTETIIEPGAFGTIPETAYKISGIRFELPAANQAPTT
jgi:hypothetical protein